MSKIQKLLFSLLILLLPTQIAKHFWPDWSLVNGLRVDYLSPTIYLTDILIIGILISWAVEEIKVRHSGKRVKRAHPESDSGQARMTKAVILFLSFSVFLLVNCFFSRNQPAAFYKLIKIVEFSLLGLYVAKKITTREWFNYLITGAVIYSSLIAIVQFLIQGSIGGIFWWLGERTFTSATPGIAQTVWSGQLLLRSYATFPHPNVLAGFLVISLILIIWQRPRFWWLSGGLGTISLFLTFSKTAIFVYLLSLIFYLLFKKRWALIFLIILMGLISLIKLSIQPESINLRWDLNLAALQIWRSSSLFGVGLDNFLVRLPEFYRFTGPVYFLQPAHNFYLMVLAETGLIGLISLIGLIGLTARRLLLTTNYQLVTTLFAILAISFFDHYFYTLQQGQILLTIILGMSWSKFIQPSKDAVAH